jgi:hypothetical protein
VTLDETASYDHRGVCIEGAVSVDHVLSLVDWLPKQGFNSYFIQFREAYTFFQRWYASEDGSGEADPAFDLDRARAYTRRIRAAVKARGLWLHMVGHGWTCEPFGISGTGWYRDDGELPEATRRHLALIKGVRELWHGVALNTNLCYGNPETRSIMVDSIVEYARTNEDVDIVHVWLADGSNNHCECELCVEREPADWYVMLLNEIDSALTDAGLDTRIVFLIYVDLLWPPRTEALRNPDRFILMFAPISRSYNQAFSAGAEPLPDLPPFERNHLSFPKDPAANVAFLRGWQQGFSGDSFDFDYHYMWDHFTDPAQTALPRVLHQDLQCLRDIGLNGFISCQVQRAFLPTGLGMTVMGRTLWDRTLTFDQIRQDHFRHCFGADGPRVWDWLEQVGERLNRVTRGDATDTDACVAGLDEIPDLVAPMAAYARERCGCAQPVVSRSWMLLTVLCEYCIRLGRVLRKRLQGREDEARTELGAVLEWLREHEAEIHPVFDVYLGARTLPGRLRLKR